MGYFVTMTTHVPDGTADDAVADVRARDGLQFHEVSVVSLLTAGRRRFHRGQPAPGRQPDSPRARSAYGHPVRRGRGGRTISLRSGRSRGQ
jgi:hypothetical protein